MRHLKRMLDPIRENWRAAEKALAELPRQRDALDAALEFEGTVTSIQAVTARAEAAIIDEVFVRVNTEGVGLQEAADGILRDAQQGTWP